MKYKEIGFEVGNWQQMNDALLQKVKVTRDANFSDKEHEWCTHKFEITEDILLGDMVARLVFDKEDTSLISLGSYFARHKNFNKQYIVKGNELFMKHTKISFSFEASENIKKHFDFVTYVRDEPSGNWIIHGRLIARYNGTHQVWTTRPRNIKIVKLPFDKFFYLRREKTPWFPINMGCLSECRKNDWAIIKMVITR